MASWGFPKEKFTFVDSNRFKNGLFFCDVLCIGTDELFALNKESQIVVTSTMHYEIIPFLARNGMTNVMYEHDLLFDRTDDARFSPTFRDIMSIVGTDMNISIQESWNLHKGVQETIEIPGCIAEVGVYKGGSAMILSQDLERHLHLFDTFEGLPQSKIVEQDLVKADWLSDVGDAALLRTLENMKHVNVHKGVFPETAAHLSCEQFSLIHLDADIYQTTLDGLKYFWPRLSPGGQIIIHDFNNQGCPGVKRATLEFSVTPMIEYAETQVMLSKR